MTSHKVEDGTIITPKLAPLDVHGVDDDGVYHAPSRARYEEMQATIDTLGDRVQELLTSNTKLEDERRLYKALYTSARALLESACIDLPLLSAVPEAITLLRDGLKAVADRNALLERDTWSGAALMARAFVAEYSKQLKAVPPADPQERAIILGRMLDEWSGKFAALLGIEIKC